MKSIRACIRRPALLCSLLASAALIVAGCDTGTHFHEATLSGVPDCAPRQVLRRPMCVGLGEDGQQHHQRKIFSSFAQVDASISLPDEARTWMLRAGVCENERSLDSPSYRCGECQVYWELEVTTLADTSRLAVPPPADFECIGPSPDKPPGRRD